jgi:hypothetical protein
MVTPEAQVAPPAMSVLHRMLVRRVEFSLFD